VPVASASGEGAASLTSGESTGSRPPRGAGAPERRAGAGGGGTL